MKRLRNRLNLTKDDFALILFALFLIGLSIVAYCYGPLRY